MEGVLDFIGGVVGFIEVVAVGHLGNVNGLGVEE